MRRIAAFVSPSLRRRIDGLDPETQDEQIVDLTSNWLYANPPLFTLTYTHLFVRHAAVPSIARVLDRGGRGKAVAATRQRNEDTLALFGEWFRHGYASERGRRATAEVRSRHAGFPIAQEDLRYVLATLVFEPRRLLAQFGLEPLTRTEERARFVFWRNLGADLGIEGIPGGEDELLDWMLVYERERYAHTAGGRRIADALHDDWAARWLPRPLRPMGVRLARALMDERLRAAHRMPPPAPTERAVLDAFVRGYFAALKVRPPRAPRYANERYGALTGGVPRLRPAR